MASQKPKGHAGALPAALACVAVAAILLGRWWPQLEEGIQSLNWPSVPGELVRASYHSDYVGGGRDNVGEIRDDFTTIVVAYWVPGGDGTRKPQATRRFDAASGLLPQPGMMTGKAFEVQHALKAGDALLVYYDPNHPERGVIVPGPSWITTLFLAFPLTLLGVAIGLWRWRAARNEQDHVGLLVSAILIWPAIFLMVAWILGTLLPPISVRIFGRMLEWWIVPVAYGGAFALYARPALMKRKVVQSLALTGIVGVVLTLVIGIVVISTSNHREAFGTEWSDDELLQRLGAEHPAVAEDAAWNVRRNGGPRAAAPALEALLQNPSVEVRRATAAALTRIGPAALPALGAVETAFAEPENAGIHRALLKTRNHLRGYVSTKERIEVHRHALRSGDSVQQRQAAVWALGQAGELAVVAQSDLETALRDPRNEHFAHMIKEVLEGLERYSNSER